MRIGYRLLVPAALSIFLSSPSRAQWLYVSELAPDCTVDMGASIVRGQYPLYVYAPDHGQASGAYFRLDVADLGAEDNVVVTLQPGVTYTGDIRTGMFVSFPSPGTAHEHLLTLSFVDHEPLAPPFLSGWLFARVRDGVLTMPGGLTIPMESMDANRVHCYGFGGIDFRPPASREVVIGKTTQVTFQGVSSGGYWGPGATNLVATDTAGWVSSMSGVLWNYGCGKCPWFWEPLVLIVTVPDDAPPGATTLVTVSEGGIAFTQFSLEAVAVTAVESMTWGAIKALYR